MLELADDGVEPPVPEKRKADPQVDPKDQLHPHEPERADQEDRTVHLGEKTESGLGRGWEVGGGKGENIFQGDLLSDQETKTNPGTAINCAQIKKKKKKNEEKK